MSDVVQHSKLSPSSAYRWRHCTSSVQFIADNAHRLPPDTSRYADEGTRAHAYLTASLKHTIGQVPDNEEMRLTIDTLVKYIYSLMLPGDSLFVDQRIPLFYLPKENGTLDVSIVGNGRLIVLDLKYGAGVSVDVFENDQTAIYGEGQIRLLELVEFFPDTTPVTLIIYQPRDRSNSEPVRKWETTRGALREFCAPLQVAADDILAGRNLKFSPGKPCDFCRAKGICTAYAARGLIALSDEPVDTVIASSAMTQLTSPDALTREQRQRVLASKATLIEWLEAVENQEVADLMSGLPPAEFKLVEGKSNRVWGDPKAAATLLSRHLTQEQVFPPVVPELVSPAQAEKLLKATHEEISESEKREFQRCITKPPGKPSLVPITDKRPALSFNLLVGLTNLDTDITDLI